MAAAGITNALGMVSVTMLKRTLAPGLSRSPGLAASAQTCTVVLAGSVAGLTTVTRAGTSIWPLVRRMAAALPILMLAVSACGMLARATTREVSITVSKGLPVAAISPA